MQNKQQRRLAVFETNSSSSHSLTIEPTALVKQPFSDEVLKSGELEIQAGEYGWEWYRYYEPKNKIAYLMTQVTSGDLTHRIDEMKENNAYVQMLADVVKEHTGCEIVTFGSTGYVDHQSAIGDKGVGMELFKSLDDLKAFIFSMDSYIETGNDNSSPPWSIDTDRGNEQYHKNLVAPIPDDFVHIELTEIEESYPSAFATSLGGVVFEANHLNVSSQDPDLFDALWSSAIVTSCRYECLGSYDSFSHDPVKSRAVDTLLDLSSGVKVSPDFSADYKYSKAEYSSEVLKISCAIPKDISDRLDALDPNAAHEVNLTIAQNRLKRGEKHLADRPENDFYKKEIVYWTAKIAMLNSQIKAKVGSRKSAKTRGNK